MGWIDLEEDILNEFAERAHARLDFGFDIGVLNIRTRPNAQTYASRRAEGSDETHGRTPILGTADRESVRKASGTVREIAARFGVSTRTIFRVRAEQ